jgi:hypothetical protein
MTNAVAFLTLALVRWLPIRKLDISMAKDMLEPTRHHSDIASREHPKRAATHAIFCRDRSGQIVKLGRLCDPQESREHAPALEVWFDVLLGARQASCEDGYERVARFFHPV